MKTMLGSTGDLQRMLKNMVETVLQSNAEMAAGQEQALSITTNRAKSQMKDLSLAAGEAGASISELKESLVSNTSQ